MIPSPWLQPAVNLAGISLGAQVPAPALIPSFACSTPISPAGTAYTHRSPRRTGIGRMDAAR